MAKISAPNKEYSGRGAHGVAFADGVGHCDDPVAIDWFRRHGYGVEGADVPEGEVATIFEDPRAAETQTFNSSRPPEDAEASKGMTDEQRREAYGEAVGDLLVSPTGTPEIAKEYPTQKDNVVEEEESKPTVQTPAPKPKPAPRKSTTAKAGGSKSGGSTS